MGFGVGDCPTTVEVGPGVPSTTIVLPLSNTPAVKRTPTSAPIAVITAAIPVRMPGTVVQKNFLSFMGGIFET